MAKKVSNDEGHLNSISLVVLGLVAVISIVGLVMLLSQSQVTGNAVVPVGECVMANGNVQPVFSEWQLDRISSAGFECKAVE